MTALVLDGVSVTLGGARIVDAVELGKEANRRVL